MLRSPEVLLCSFVLCIILPDMKHTVLAKKFSITLKAPGNTSAPTPEPHRSVHVRYIPTNEERQEGTIVGFEPLIQFHQKAVAQLTVHLCDSRQSSSVWYDDDESICDSAPSMLIYEWTPYSSPSIFRTTEDCGFEFNETRSIVLTVIYRKERRLHKEQSGVVLYISLQPAKYHMGTMLVGNTYKGTHFSCRSSNYPRLLYALKNLNSNENKLSWRMHMIRVRQFGRKLVQPVFDSKVTSHINHTNIEMALPDLFLMRGDYLLIECDNLAQSSCYFLIYYVYKAKLLPNDDICQSNDYPSLFKLVPSREALTANQPVKPPISIDGSTVFLIICLLLLAIWISIIAGCIIMRRIRGLVNFRTEPVSSFTAQKNKFLPGRMYANDNYQRNGEIEHIMQNDMDHGGMTG